MTRPSPPTAPPRAAVFDLDGLLVDSEPLFEETARRLLARRGRELDLQVLRAMMGTPARESLLLFRDAHRLTESVSDLIEESAALFFEVAGEHPVPLMPGALRLLDRLRLAGMPCALATSSPREYVERVLGPHGLLDRFRFALTADDVRQGKPHPEIYEMAADLLGLMPTDMVVLEDSINGLRSAVAAGARCVVVPHERVPREALSGAAMVACRLDSPEVLRMLLGRDAQP